MINNLTEIQNILCNLCGNVLFGKNNRILENFDSGELFTEAKHQTISRQLRKVTKSKAVFPTDNSLFKMIYLAMMYITKKWTGRRQDWGMIHAQLSIHFADRMPD